MGCQLNENDSEKLVGMVEQMGYTESESLNDADLYLINTCCVRENAEEKVFGKLGELKKIKENKDIIIAIYDKSLTKRGEYRALIGIELLPQ